MLTWRAVVLVPVAVTVALAGLVYGVEEFVLVAVAAGGVLVAAVVVTTLEGRRMRRHVGIEVECPTGEVLVGDDVQLRVEVRTRRTALLALGVDGAPAWQVEYPGLHRGPRAEQAAPERVGTVAAPRYVAGRRRLVAPLLVGLPGEGRRRVWGVDIAVPADRRGVWSMPPLALWCEDPFGLVAVRIASGPPAHLIVCPDPDTGRPDMPLSSLDADPYEAPLSEAPLGRRPGDELAGLRAYVAGDRITRVHWPVFASRGELVVRDFVEPALRRVEIVVDVRAAVIEASVADAAAAGAAALQAGTAIDLRTTAGERLQVAPGVGSRTLLLQALACLAPLQRRRR